MKVTYKTYNLAFRYPFTISNGRTKTHQPTLIVRLEHLGRVGFGEAPAITYYNIPVEKMVEDLERKRIFVEKFAFTEPERWWHYLHHLFPANPFLVCALDIAGWDLYGQIKGKPLGEFWKPSQPKQTITDYTIGIDTVEKMVAKMQEKPWPVYKIKLGTDNDIAIIEALRKHTDAVFRIDANAGWKASEALEKITAFKDLGVEFIEQPLAKDDWEGMKFLYEKSPLPLYADEACVAESDVDKCHLHFHGINIKLTKCSGLTPALRMIERARELKMGVMVGSMNESTVGSAAIAHLQSLIDYLDADGPLLLREDVATGLLYENNGNVVTSTNPGLGITFTDLYQK
ncbi:dipeptide epimerase [Flavisolibacter ginsenosidimutans]|uniref:Dipeptide epimerase n=1 Tax=Flavisolibacter ginsenosidimutans TaxID=661481 RepID=A0A5B8UF02_9BACT|nr:dipeptide epimerase [Flavisolibacter ginsenosidimutans]QEC55144.1 dipeptide epimerase [Flavisolibacter ginsenosidimutans]